MAKMDRREAKPYLVMAFNSIDPANKENYIKAFDTIVEALEQPEIIHCKNCIHTLGIYGSNNLWCGKNKAEVPLEHFCGWAKRRTDETD